jgi:hypothetical protein
MQLLLPSYSDLKVNAYNNLSISYKNKKALIILLQSLLQIAFPLKMLVLHYPSYSDLKVSNSGFIGSRFKHPSS